MAGWLGRGGGGTVLGRWYFDMMGRWRDGKLVEWAGRGVVGLCDIGTVRGTVAGGWDGGVLRSGGTVGWGCGVVGWERGTRVAELKDGRTLGW